MVNIYLILLAKYFYIDNISIHHCLMLEKDFKNIFKNSLLVATTPGTKDYLVHVTINKNDSGLTA